MIKYSGVEYKQKSDARRDAIHCWCEQYGDGLGERAQFVDRNLEQCARDMLQEWEIPFLDEEDRTTETFEELLLDFVDDAGIVRFQ